MILREEHWQPIGDPGEAVTFDMGDLEGEDNERTPNGKLLRVTLPSFEIAGLLTTSAQYWCFAQSKDYSNPRWWPGSAATWFAEESKDSDGGIWPRFIVDQPKFTGTHSEYINFWEAQAYALWENDQRVQNEIGAGRKRVTLPTEAQWECAARSATPQGQRWRFGHTKGEWDQQTQRFTDIRPWDFNHALLLGWNRSPVGIFTESAAAQLHDLAGTQWEWTGSGYSETLEKEYVCNYVDDESTRVMRGGSFFSTAARCRVGYRFRNEPVNYDDYFGFPLVRVRVL